jgi:hypothetical protein
MTFSCFGILIIFSQQRGNRDKCIAYLFIDSMYVYESLHTCVGALYVYIYVCTYVYAHN